MPETSNPRKLTTSGNVTVVSIPPWLLDETGLQKGDEVVLKPTKKGFEAVEVEYQVVSS
jgi:antitoxin component of MazEF toxin-antitoxin module